MTRYMVRRLAQGLFVVWMVSVAIFLLSHVTGDPAELLLPEEAGEEQAAFLREKWGLDKPLHVQYFVFVKSALHGDLGISYVGNRQVGKLIAERLPNSARLCGLAMLIALLVGIPIAVAAAIWKDNPVDYLARLIVILGISVPHFLVAILFIELFAVLLGWLPTSGMDSGAHYVLPALVLCLTPIAGVVRLLRSSMLEVMDSDYIKLARIKGVSEVGIVWKHTLRNALIPVVTFAGMEFAILITAAVILEVIFAWPGIGRLAYEAILARDFPVMRGVILMVASIVVAMNLFVDILYAYIDPRIRYK